MNRPLTFGDLFCGGGGTTTGALMVPDVEVLWAVNHSAIAIATHKHNHPETKHYEQDIRLLDEKKLFPVDALWASLECFAKGTLIITERGLVPIEDVVVGDKALTHLGRYRKVTKTSCRYSDTISVKGQGHPGIEVTTNHPFYMVEQNRVWDNSRRTYNYKVYSQPKWVSAGSMNEKKRYRWATPIDYDVLPIPSVLGRGIDVNDTNFWWLIGRWLGDGLVSLSRIGQISITCGKHEREELWDRLKNFYPKGKRAEGGELRWRYRELGTAGIFYCTHKHLSLWIVDNFGKLAGGKTIPTWAFSMNRDYRQSLIDGYVSADGCTGKTRIQTCSISKKLSLGIRLLAETLGHRASLHKYKQHCNVIEERKVNVHDCWIVAWDKNSRCRGYCSIGMHSYGLIKEISNKGQNVKVYNLSVADDESYVADGIVVHNCTNFSIAKGGKAKNEDSRTLAWELPRFVEHCQPKIIWIENVREFLTWGPLDSNNHPDKSLAGTEYDKWVAHICSMGYKFAFKILNSADFGSYTSRRRFFGVFWRADLPDYVFPQPTHNKKGTGGLKKWNACRDKIDCKNHGNSIFGRERPLCANTFKRIVGGIHKYCPEFEQYLSQLRNDIGYSENTKASVEKKQFITQYYGNSCSNGLDEPLHTITTKDRHTMISFIADHCQVDNYQKIESPLMTQTTRQTKQFIVAQYNSKGNPGANARSLDDPAFSLTTTQKLQFISMYYNSSGKPETQNNSVDSPLPTITTSSNKQALVTLLDGFDIKMRFLEPEELASITGFPDGYFDKAPTKKQKVWLIGNAVPTIMSQRLIETLMD